MDDIAALRQFGLAPLTDVAVFKPANATRGLDRPIVTYLPEDPAEAADDRLPRREGPGRALGERQSAAQAGRDRAGGGDDDFPRGPQGAPMAAGVNRFTWDLNSTGVVTFPGMILWGATQNGPAVLPGSYQVRLTADGVTQTQSFQVLEAPAAPDQRRRPAVPVDPREPHSRQGQRSEPRGDPDPPHQDRHRRSHQGRAGGSAHRRRAADQGACRRWKRTSTR